MSQKITQFIKENNIEYVDLRFTDTKGKEQHITIPSQIVDSKFFEQGKMFDGSSIAGWRPIDKSDMILKPDADALFCLDPFTEVPTLILRCDIIDPLIMQGYNRDPRSIAKKAEAYLKSTGIADQFLIGPEPEFFIFDDVKWHVNMNSSGYNIDSIEAAWNSNKEYPEGNYGHRPGIKGGYFPVPPVDSAQDLRTEMCRILSTIGITVEAHHHEVATANQNEIATACNTLTNKADELQLFKYIVHNTAHRYGKTATFMPKPLVGDNGSGMHCHQSLSKGDKNIFAGKEYAGLSEQALFFIGGIIHHAKALNAFTNPATNSYKRLVPGFEAPVLLAYSSCNRSASIRVPFTTSEKGRRIEVRFPDPCANPYLGFAAMLMAGLDGIVKRLHPGAAMDHDLYELSAEEQKNIPTVAHSLEEALAALKKDHDFLTQGEVFTHDMLEAYINLKQKEAQAINMTTHPLEFQLYYSV
jgi:glutamine synthetase